MKFENGKWSCLWPSGRSNQTIQDFVKQEKSPEKKWTRHTQFDILTWCSDYETGIRRLRKSFTREDNLETTDSDSENQSNITILSKAQAKSLFKRSYETDSSDEEEHVAKKKTTTSVKQGKKNLPDIPEDSEDDSYSNLSNKSSSSKIDDMQNHKLTSPKNGKKLKSCCKYNENLEQNKFPENHEIYTKTLIESTNSPRNRDLKYNAKNSTTVEEQSAKIPIAHTPRSSRENTDKSVTLEEQQLRKIREKIKDPELALVLEYIDVKSAIETNKICRYVDNSKRRFAYDVKSKIDELNTTFTTGIHGSNMSTPSAMMALAKKFPINILEDFLTMETEMDVFNQPDDETKEEALKKRNALKQFILMKSTASDYKKCVPDIIRSIIGRNIQLEYSGAGRKIKGSGKLPSNKTITYACMEEVLRERFPGEKEMKLLTVTSNCLTSAICLKGNENKIEAE